MVFLLVLMIIFTLILLIVFSKIKFEIINFEFSSTHSSTHKKHINPNYKIILSWYILGKIPVIRIKLNENKIKKIKLKEKMVDIDVKLWRARKKINKHFFQIIKKLDFNIKKLNLKIDIGTENAVLTSILVPAISTIISLFLRKRIKTKEKQFFTIQPIFKNQNYLNMELSGIFEIKMNHIINIIYVLIKKEKEGVKEDERTSNRRPYDYSYE